MKGEYNSKIPRRPSSCAMISKPPPDSIHGSSKDAAEKEELINRIDTAHKRYKNNFTMHALSHIINGTLIEKVFWTLKLVTAISIAGYLSRTLFTSYLNHDTDTVIDIKTVNRLQLPSVHVCGKNSKGSK